MFCWRAAVPVPDRSTEQEIKLQVVDYTYLTGMPQTGSLEP